MRNRNRSYAKQGLINVSGQALIVTKLDAED